MLTHRTGMVTRKPDHQREHEGNRNTIAQGMPALPCEPVVTNLCAFSNRTQGCGCAQAPGIPCALFLRGHGSQNSERHDRSRERETLCGELKGDDTRSDPLMSSSSLQLSCNFNEKTAARYRSHFNDVIGLSWIPM